MDAPVALSRAMRTWLARFWRFWRALSVAFVFLFLIVHFTPLIPWYTRILASPQWDPNGDILIVLTADMLPDNLMGGATYWRAIYAVRTYRAGHFRAVVVCGGPGGGTRSLAAVTADFLVANDIPREVIHLEERSTSTRENALFATAMMAGWPGKKVLLTSDTHMFRAYRAFRAAGLAVVPCYFPHTLKLYSSLLNRWSLFCGLVQESAKIAYYYARGWI
jgi:uncharacterized SAM-binding protein YcdF (DUF218 family)